MIRVLVLCVSSVLGCANLPAADRPNIIVFYTDDHGHADLSCQGVLQDVKTPHIDALAASGARMVHGYSTAPQCVPSRAGLLIGKFQSRFGVETNGASLAGFDSELTIAERLQSVGYVTAQFGKWHLGPTTQIPRHGFRHVFAQNAQRPFSANIGLSGRDRPMSDLKPQRYHVDGCSEAAAAVIRRYQDQPFFLYIAYRAPHVPLDAPPQYLSRFPGKMPERRRQALAMISATDDGVGLITETLRSTGLTRKTLIFYIGDNGAPLKIHKADLPGGGPGWDGSLNDPLNGEKGMLSEGGMHVPFVVAWPGTIPRGQTYPHPVSALDVAATAVSIAGMDQGNNDTVADQLDGVNLIPFLAGDNDGPPHEMLAWRWGAQSAIREGDWKLLRGGEREYLYRLDSDLEEKENLVSKHPEVAKRLRGHLTAWSEQLVPPGLAVQKMSETWNDYFDYYLDGKPAPPLRAKFRNPAEVANTQRADIEGWVGRNGALNSDNGDLVFLSKGGFIARNGLKLSGPLELTLTAQVDREVTAAVTWRHEGEKDFSQGHRAAFSIPKSESGREVTVTIPSEQTVVHLRLAFSRADVRIQKIAIRTNDGKTQPLWR